MVAALQLSTAVAVANTAVRVGERCWWKKAAKQQQLLEAAPSAAAFGVGEEEMVDALAALLLTVPVATADEDDAGPVVAIANPLARRR